MKPLLSKKILVFESIMDVNLDANEDNSCKDGALIMIMSKTVSLDLELKASVKCSIEVK